MAEGENTAKKEFNRYEGLKPEIADKLEEYDNNYFRWDKPVPFCGLMVYPAIITDYELFSSCSGCLTLNRKEDPKGILMTNLEYLYYKMQCKDNEKAEKEGKILSYSFSKLCEIVFHIKNGLKCKKCNKVIGYDSKEFIQYFEDIRNMTLAIQQGKTENIDTPHFRCPECGEEKFAEMIKFATDPETKKAFLLVDGHKISSKDFDLLRQLILYQNFPDYQDDS